MGHCLGLSWICGVLADYRGVLGDGCVGFDDSGVIRRISRDPPPGSEARDYRDRGYIVAPGLIDLHVHLRGLELSYKETEETGCLAAASSGITLIVDMPNTKPPLRRPEALDRKLRDLDSDCVVDHGVYAGLPEDPSLVEELASRPIAGFKVYPEDLQSPALGEVLSRRTLVILHPETPEAYRSDLATLELRGRASHRGCWWETLAVLLLAREHQGRGARVHVTHASCPGTVEAARGMGYTVDVTPHHLFYSAERARDPCLHRVNPPLRPEAERAGLVKLLLEGRVDALASDHAPHEPREKSLPPTCPPGYPWLEAWPWLLYRLVASGALSLGEYLWLTSRGPALILGLKNYGALAPGYRANLLVFNPRARRHFQGPRHSKAKLTPAFMEELAGEPVETIVGGQTVYLKGELLEHPESPLNPFARQP
jgi:dihydroorotase